MRFLREKCIFPEKHLLTATLLLFPILKNNNFSPVTPQNFNQKSNFWEKLTCFIEFYSRFVTFYFFKSENLLQNNRRFRYILVVVDNFSTFNFDLAVYKISNLIFYSIDFNHRDFFLILWTRQTHLRKRDLPVLSSYREKNGWNFMISGVIKIIQVFNFFSHVGSV